MGDEELREFDPVIDAFLDGPHKLVKVEMEGQLGDPLTRSLNLRIESRKLEGKVKASTINDVVYLEKIPWYGGLYRYFHVFLGAFLGALILLAQASFTLLLYTIRVSMYIVGKGYRALDWVAGIILRIMWFPFSLFITTHWELTCGYCQYRWRPRTPHNRNNPPSKCPNCGGKVSLEKK